MTTTDPTGTTGDPRDALLVHIGSLALHRLPGRRSVTLTYIGEGDKPTRLNEWEWRTPGIPHEMLRDVHATVCARITHVLMMSTGLQPELEGWGDTAP